MNVARQALIKDRTAAKNGQKVLTLSLLKKQNADRLRNIEKQIAAIDCEIATRIAVAETLKSRLDILQSIPGIATTTASILLFEMPELGHMQSEQAARLAGLAPITRQSGQWKGKSFIGGGRANVRRALYMPALVAARHNPDLKDKYQALIKAGKPAKLAIAGIMRKLIVIANALLKKGVNWTKIQACT